jgi:hypothetical protein
MSAHAVALAYLMSQNTEEQSEIRLPSITTHGMIVGKASSSSPVLQPAPIASATAPVVRLDARSFLIAIRDAGRRLFPEVISEKGAVRKPGFYTDPTKVREDQVKAIHAYVGYDTTADFGPQEMNARAKANRELTGKAFGGPTLAETKLAHKTAKGYVKGLPQTFEAKRDDLLAREKLAVETMILHETQAQDMTRSMAERELSCGLADFEAEKLTAIRTDLRLYGIDH